MKGLIKLAPIVVILACAASLFFAFKLNGIKKGLEGDKASLEGQVQTEKGKVQEAKATIAEKESEIDAAGKELSTVKAKIGAFEVQIAQKTRELDDLAASKTQVAAELDTTKEKLASAEKTAQTLKDKFESVEFKEVEDLNKQIAVLTKEKDVFAKQAGEMKTANAKLTEEIAGLRDTPAGTRGRVALTETDWNLVVLDIGKEDKVHTESNFLLFRDSQLIGKARITSVNRDNSVGELVPGFTLGVPRPGDQAVLEAAEKM